MNQPMMEEASLLTSFSMTPCDLTPTPMPMLHQPTPDDLEEFGDANDGTITDHQENQDSEKDPPTNGKNTEKRTGRT